MLTIGDHCDGNKRYSISKRDDRFTNNGNDDPSTLVALAAVRMQSQGLGGLAGGPLPVTDFWLRTSKLHHRTYPLATHHSAPSIPCHRTTCDATASSIPKAISLPLEIACCNPAITSVTMLHVVTISFVHFSPFDDTHPLKSNENQIRF